MAVFLHAAGFHCLTFDVRGHGANPPEELPLSAGEFGLDTPARRSARCSTGRRSRSAAIAGHSMGGIGAHPGRGGRPARRRSSSRRPAPADPYRLTRQTFRLAHLPIPDPIAYPLAWLTTRVYLRPRGHVVADVSATPAHRPLPRTRPARPRRRGRASSRASHLERLAAAARAGRAGDRDAARSRRSSSTAASTPGCTRSRPIAGPWREFAGARPSAARSTRTTAGEIAAATAAERIPDAEARFAAIEDIPGGFRTLAQVALPGATRPIPVPTPPTPPATSTPMSEP